MLARFLLSGGSVDIAPTGPKRLRLFTDDDWFLWIIFACALLFFFAHDAFAQARLPGADASDKLEAAGTLLRIVDSVLFSWGARLLAGLCVMSAGWNLKEQRFGIAILCVAAAIILGTAPMWVKNIFTIGGGGGVFSSYVMPLSGAVHA